MFDVPETHYAKSGDLHIAYQVTGTGSRDLIFVPGFVSHLDLQLQDHRAARFFERLSSFSRLIRFDKRGTGLSDQGHNVATLEERMDDLRAIMDAVGSERAAVLGYSEGGAMSALFSATYPDRTSALVLLGSMARFSWSSDYPWGRTPEQFADRRRLIKDHWGTGQHADIWAPSIAANQDFRRLCGWIERSGASPTSALALVEMNQDIDIRHVLPSINVPTLVVHAIGDRIMPIGHGRYLGKTIPGAKMIEIDGMDHLPWCAGSDTVVDEIEGFLTGVRRGPEPDRVLATVLFTDIVGSTGQAVKAGDKAWREKLIRHHALVRDQLARYRGREVDNAGDGFFAVFDGPARAVRCAQAIVASVQSLDMQLRAGVHTGECEKIGEKFGGLAIHIGSRVASHAGAGEILVSSTVKDLVAGSGLTFEDRGRHTLKGIPGEWQLYSAIQ
jgi:pimeloyl-ACP methyl ester carboxylesterase